MANELANAATYGGCVSHRGGNDPRAGEEEGTGKAQASGQVIAMVVNIIPRSLLRKRGWPHHAVVDSEVSTGFGS